MSIQTHLTQLNQSGTNVVSVPQSLASINTIDGDVDISNMIDEMQDILDAALMDPEVCSDESDGVDSIQNELPNTSNVNSNKSDIINKQKKLSSLIHQITNANDVNDIEPIIKYLNVFDDIKQLLLNKITELPLYDEKKQTINNDNIYKRKQHIQQKLQNTDSEFEQLQIKDDNDNDETLDEKDDECTLSLFARTFSINTLYYECTEINQIFNDQILCNIIIYLSKCSMYRKIPILSTFFMHLMKNSPYLYKQYVIDIPYSIYISKTSKFYGKILHETNTIKIYNKLQICKQYKMNNINFLNVIDIDDNRTIGSGDEGLGSNDSHISNASITYDIESIDLEFEINDIQDLTDNIAYNIWTSIPKWNFHLNNLINQQDNKYINYNKKWNEILNKMLEKASSSIQCITINKTAPNSIISANDIIHFATFENLKYLNASNDFIITFLDYSNECNYILSNLLCVDCIYVDDNIVNIINNNLQRLLILTLHFDEDKNNSNYSNDNEKQKPKQTRKHQTIKLAKTLEFIQINGFDFNATKYSLDFSECSDLICVKFKESTFIRDELFDNIICERIQKRILWNQSLIQCFIIDEIDREYNSCWFRYFQSFSDSETDLELPQIQYIRYMDEKNLRIVEKKYKAIIEGETDLLTSELESRTSRPITASPMLKYNNSLSIHNNENEENNIIHMYVCDDNLYHNPLENMQLTKLKEIGHKIHDLYTILSDYNNNGILWRLLIINKYKNDNEMLKNKLQIYRELVDLNAIKWVKSLGYKKIFMPFVNLSFSKRFSEFSNI